MRATTVFNRLLRLVGVWVIAVEFVDDDRVVVVDVRVAPAAFGMPALRVDHCGSAQLAAAAVDVAGVGLGRLAGGGALSAAQVGVPPLPAGDRRGGAVRTA